MPQKQLVLFRYEERSGVFESVHHLVDCLRVFTLLASTGLARFALVHCHGLAALHRMAEHIDSMLARGQRCASSIIRHPALRGHQLGNEPPFQFPIR